MASLFFACLLLWAVIILVCFVAIGSIFLSLIENFFGLVFLVALVPAILTTLYLDQKEKINTLETRISKLEQLQKEHSND